MQILITAVPERLNMALGLKRQFPDAEILVDTHHEGSWFNLHQALIAMEEDALILQDDLIACLNAREIIRNALIVQPVQQIMFWGINRPWMEACQKKSCSWIARIHGGTGQAQYLPYTHAKEFLLWVDKSIEFTHRNSDLRLAIWRTLNQMPAFYLYPELFKHIGRISALGTGNNKNEGLCWNGNPALEINSRIHVVREDITDIGVAFLERHGQAGLADAFRAAFLKLREEY